MSLSQYKFVVFDLDGTLIEPLSSWKYLHEKLGTWRLAEKNADLFYSGKVTWEEWAKRDARLWAGSDVSRIIEIAHKCTVAKGAKETVCQLRDNNLSMAIVSGGISFFAEEVARELGISHVVANELVQDSGFLTGEVVTRVTPNNKPIIVQSLLRQLKLSWTQTIAVGDDFTMLPLFKVTGLSIAFNPRSVEVERSAHLVVKSSNLTDILSLIGSAP